MEAAATPIANSIEGKNRLTMPKGFASSTKMRDDQSGGRLPRVHLKKSVFFVCQQIRRVAIFFITCPVFWPPHLPA